MGRLSVNLVCMGNFEPVGGVCALDRTALARYGSRLPSSEYCSFRVITSSNIFLAPIYRFSPKSLIRCTSFFIVALFFEMSSFQFYSISLMIILTQNIPSPISLSLSLLFSLQILLFNGILSPISFSRNLL